MKVPDGTDKCGTTEPGNMSNILLCPLLKKPHWHQWYLLHTKLPNTLEQGTDWITTCALSKEKKCLVKGGGHKRKQISINTFIC